MVLTGERHCISRDRFVCGGEVIDDVYDRTAQVDADVTNCGKAAGVACTILVIVEFARSLQFRRSPVNSKSLFRLLEALP
ncbi:hypothetical protein HBI56_048540 [Parastagonospora nodorum]|uniref:Uncharacterized protein n=1 Tax=Phaeosphaeria nodorum (strain SN15 / ATCC MYA-4574 / FGSC 10173) TaxID=321614 RepID=A0A7U2HVM0_PHANO|nr:hypothetical protein HBH56_061470 [Parastagonospora nodorum]QRC91979.1 hypothetical protein JI435_401880 [Parastagonospora nodorum SN15]KAH3931084.1 hypothetical protein HBH54_105410 [Parastagonospora nodorum]KAH3954550.1 hypothetical protein HBH53_020090 [Parastagonospora nodorum]KAH3968081.1 hypothetical protein HBH51_133370 [Parastagonospora nodorum]